MQGKIVVITGASGALGKVVAASALAKGARIAGIDHAASTSGATKERIEFGGVDLTDPGQAKTAIDAAARHFGKLDVLVNNAGISGSAEQDFYSTEAWHRIMAVNATGVFFGIKHAIPAMIANGGGSIVNLSSIAGIIGSEQVHMAYNASKAAVRLMTKSVAVQHAKDKIRCNSVHPGIMPPMRTSGRTADPAVRAERMRVIPMRRPGEVDDVAYTILFLASDEASYITGSEVHVDEGALAI